MKKAACSIILFTVFLLTTVLADSNSIIKKSGQIPSPNVVIDDAGNLGIGTTQPQGDLDVTPEIITTSTYSYPFPNMTNTQVLNLEGMGTGAMTFDNSHVTSRFWDGLKWKAATGVDLVIVNSIFDLPAPSGDRIILENKYYRGGSEETFVLPYRLDVSNSPSLFNLNFAYVGSGPFLVADAAFGFFVTKLTSFIDVFNSNTLFDITADDSVFNFMIWEENLAAGWLDLGTVRKKIISFRAVNFEFFGFGLKLENCEAVTFTPTLFRNGFNIPGAVHLTVSGNNESLTILGGNFIPQSNEYMFNFPKTLNTKGVRASNSILDTRSFGGGTFAPGSRDQTDKFISFVNCADVPDSTVIGQIQISDNTDLTLIPAQNTPVSINATFIDMQIEERMTHQIECTFNADTDIITAAIDHELSSNDSLTLKTEGGSTLPTGLSEDVEYYVVTINAATFYVSENLGGATVNFTTSGTGINYYRTNDGADQGYIIYTGLESVVLDIDGELSIESSVAAARAFAPMVMKRSVTGNFTVGARGVIVSPDNTHTLPVGFSGLILLNTDEGIAIYVERRSALAANATITEMRCVIKK